MMERYPATATAVGLFLQHCRLAGFSPHTIDSYRTRLRCLDGYVHELDQSACIAYLGAELDRGLSVGTIRTTWAALASFCTFAVGQGWLTQSPMKGVPCPREAILARYLSKAELGRIWAAAGASGRRYKPHELKLVILLLLEGLRAAELCSIRWADIREGVLTVKGKGSRFRRIALSDEVLGMLDERRNGAYPPAGFCLPMASTGTAAHRGFRALDEDRNLSVERDYTTRVFAFNTGSLGERIRRLGKRAGVPGLHPHLFRHSFASNWLLEGGSPLALQELGGWASDTMIRTRYAKAALEESALRESRRLGLTRRLLDSSG